MMIINKGYGLFGTTGLKLTHWFTWTDIEARLYKSE